MQLPFEEGSELHAVIFSRSFSAACHPFCCTFARKQFLSGIYLACTTKIKVAGTPFFNDFLTNGYC